MKAFVRFFFVASLLLASNNLFAQLDYTTPAQPPAPVVQQQAQPATPTPAQATGAPSPQVQQGAGQQAQTSPNGPDDTIRAVVDVVFVLVIIGLIVCVYILFRREQGKGVSKEDVKKMIDDLPKPHTKADIEAIVKGQLPKVPTEADIIALIKKNAPTPPPPPASNVRVLISPKQAELEPGKSVEFKADVTGTDNKEVTWSISPKGLGEFTNGKYTAPAAFHKPVTLFVEAFSVADPSQKFTVKVFLTAQKNGGEKPPAPLAEPKKDVPPAQPPTAPPAEPKGSKKGIGRIGFVTLLVMLLMFAHFAYGAAKCYNPATAPRGSSATATNAIPLAVVGVSNTMVCSGSGPVEVLYLTGATVPVTGNASSFTFTPTVRGRARIKVGGVDASLLVIDDAPVAVQINAAVDLARETLSGAAPSGGSSEKDFHSFLKGIAQQYGLSEQQLLSLLRSPQPGTSKQAVAMIQAGIEKAAAPQFVNAVLADPRLKDLVSAGVTGGINAYMTAHPIPAIPAAAPSSVTVVPPVSDDHIRSIAKTEVSAAIAPVKKTADEALSTAQDASNTAGYAYDQFGQLVRVVAGMNGIKDPASEHSKAARQKTLGAMLKDLHCNDPKITQADMKKYGCSAK